MTRVAALFVDPKGPYPTLLGAENCWDEARDARTYAGPCPVVAHPPCGRWCRLAKFVESRHPSMKVGDDGGCFSSALHKVRYHLGVLEHPAWSLAWGAHELPIPPSSGWQQSLENSMEWTCEVWQSAYGHPASKATWLFYKGYAAPAPMLWSHTRGSKVVAHCTKRGDGTIWRRNADRMHSGTHLTPPAFARALIELARNCGGAP